MAMMMMNMRKNMLMAMAMTIEARGKVMSRGANKLQRPFLANSIYSRNPISKMSINSCENQINSCRH